MVFICSSMSCRVPVEHMSRRHQMQIIKEFCTSVKHVLTLAAYPTTQTGYPLEFSDPPSDRSDTPRDPQFPKSFIEIDILKPMTSMLNSRAGRKSKGERHTFVVKLDMERTRKMAELLKILDTNGIEHLTPIIEKYIDSVDLEELRDRNQEALPIAKAS